MAEDNRNRDRQDWSDDPARGTGAGDKMQQGRSGQAEDATATPAGEGTPDLDADDVDELDDEDREDDLRDDGSPNRRKSIG